MKIYNKFAINNSDMKTLLKFCLLWVLVAVGLGACSHYRKISGHPANILDQYQVYVVNQEFPRDQGWVIALTELSENVVAGNASRLNADQLSELANKNPAIDLSRRKYKIIVLTVTNQQADTIPNSGPVRLAIKDVADVQTFDYDRRHSGDDIAYVSCCIPVISIILFPLYFLN